MKTSWRRQILPIVLGTLAALGGARVLAAPAGGGEIEAIWKSQVVNFEYHGYSTQYSCRSLEKKLTRILRNVGAREGIQLRDYACDDLSGIARFQVSFESPVPATPENIAAASTSDARQQLVARVRGEPLPAAEDVQTFPAVWKTVSFVRDRELRIEPGDCELVQQLRRQVLTRMSVQIVKDNVRCSPAFGNIGRPQLSVAALVPASPDALGRRDY